MQGKTNLMLQFGKGCIIFLHHYITITKTKQNLKI